MNVSLPQRAVRQIMKMMPRKIVAKDATAIRKKATEKLAGDTQDRTGTAPRKPGTR